MHSENPDTNPGRNASNGFVILKRRRRGSNLPNCPFINLERSLYLPFILRQIAIMHVSLENISLEMNDKISFSGLFIYYSARLIRTRTKGKEKERALPGLESVFKF